MKLTSIIIAAVSDNGVIGKDGKIPWHYDESMVEAKKADMARFKKLTMHHPVIMGRKTYESIPQKFRPLFGRENIVITKNPYYHQNGVLVVNSLEDGYLKGIQSTSKGEVYIAGGGEIYDLAIGGVHKLEITKIHKEYDGDAFFPEINPEIWEETNNENHGTYSFLTYERRRK